MTADGELTAVRELLHQAKEASEGGIRTAGDRLLQHRPLIKALEYVLKRYEQDLKIDADLHDAFKGLLATLRQYPPLNWKGEEAEAEWRVRYAPAFHVAVKRIVALIERGEKIGE